MYKSYRSQSLHDSRSPSDFGLDRKHFKGFRVVQEKNSNLPEQMAKSKISSMDDSLRSQYSQSEIYLGNGKECNLNKNQQTSTNDYYIRKNVNKSDSINLSRGPTRSEREYNSTKCALGEREYIPKIRKNNLSISHDRHSLNNSNTYYA